ncbi:MAG: amino acid transporter [Vicinamibacteria bacterium]
MCLTGVDYFSTLGYQPGIAILAAGVLSPIATLILVVVTLCVALPIYAQVAKHSPHGQGSILMLEELLPRWKGKVFVLVLLGFAFTDFIITMTMSAADATAHIAENPFVPGVVGHHTVLVTSMLLLGLGAVFMIGFKEAIGFAVFIVALYLALNVVVIGLAMNEVFSRGDLLNGWWTTVMTQHGSPWMAVGIALLLFPKLALGLSGFETGVAVMPLVRGREDDIPARPLGRIRNTRKLLATAALIMSVALIASSFVTTVLIPAREFEEGGKAYGRGLSFLAHTLLGDAFGTVYDLSTIVILWFAGASAMAGLLNLVPRYLPPYGMAPDWARATRPLVLVFTLISLIVTKIFDADVNAQGGAYATGVLVLMTSAAVAVTIAHRNRGSVWVYGLMTLVFGYTTTLNILERPEGLKIASFFIFTIVVVSITSRAMRSTELRIGEVKLSPKAADFLSSFAPSPVRIIAHRPDKRTIEEYARKENQAREDHSLNGGEPVVFLEMVQGDASAFEDDIDVRGVKIGPHRILRCTAPAIPNAIAAILLKAQTTSQQTSHAYFGWTEGNPISYVLKYIFLGEGDTAPVTREVLRRAVKNPPDRPRIHVG